MWSVELAHPFPKPRTQVYYHTDLEPAREFFHQYKIEDPEDRLYLVTPEGQDFILKAGSPLQVKLRSHNDRG